MSARTLKYSALLLALGACLSIAAQNNGAHIIRKDWSQFLVVEGDTIRLRFPLNCALPSSYGRSSVFQDACRSGAFFVLEDNALDHHPDIANAFVSSINGPSVVTVLYHGALRGVDMLRLSARSVKFLLQDEKKRYAEIIGDVIGMRALALGDLPSWLTFDGDCYYVECEGRKTYVNTAELFGLMCGKYYSHVKPDMLSRMPEVQEALVKGCAPEDSLRVTIFSDGVFASVGLNKTSARTAEEVLSRANSIDVVGGQFGLALLENKVALGSVGFDGDSWAVRDGKERKPFDIYSLMSLMRGDLYCELSASDLKRVPDLARAFTVGDGGADDAFSVILYSEGTARKISLNSVSAAAASVLLDSTNLKESQTFKLEHRYSLDAIASLPSWIDCDEKGYYITGTAERLYVDVDLLFGPSGNRPVFALGQRELNARKRLKTVLEESDGCESRCNAYADCCGELFCFNFSDLEADDAIALLARGVDSYATPEDYENSKPAMHRLGQGIKGLLASKKKEISKGTRFGW